MKISVYLKKCSATTSNICFRVREKNVDIKVVSPIAVHDKWKSQTNLTPLAKKNLPTLFIIRLPL